MQRGFEAGADAYFTKPFNPDEVISALQRLIDACGGEPPAAPPLGPGRF